MFLNLELYQAFFKINLQLYKPKTRQNKAKYLSLFIKYTCGTYEWTERERNKIEQINRYFNFNFYYYFIIIFYYFL